MAAGAALAAEGGVLVASTVIPRSEARTLSGICLIPESPAFSYVDALKFSQNLGSMEISRKCRCGVEVDIGFFCVRCNRDSGVIPGHMAPHNSSIAGFAIKILVSHGPSLGVEEFHPEYSPFSKVGNQARVKTPEMIMLETDEPSPRLAVAAFPVPL